MEDKENNKLAAGNILGLFLMTIGGLGLMVGLLLVIFAIVTEQYKYLITAIIQLIICGLIIFVGMRKQIKFKKYKKQQKINHSENKNNIEN